MVKSDTIGKLAEALAKAQGVIGGAVKDSSNPFFNSKYADLASVWEACRKPLSDNGLSVVQTATIIPDHYDMVAIETTLCHTSGEFITGVLAAKPIKADPQSLGSLVTYLRRYSLAAICGVAPEDDDANMATGKQEPPKKEMPPPPKKPTGPTPAQKKALGERMIEFGVVDKAEQVNFYKFVMSDDETEQHAQDFIDKFPEAHDAWRNSNG